jgi:hypothetical protein
VLGFDRETGKLQPDRFDLAATPVPDGAKTVAVYFSVDGRNLIVQCQQDTSKELFMLKVRVKLSPAEDAQLKKRPGKPAAPAPAKRNPTRDDA